MQACMNAVLHLLARASEAGELGAQPRVGKGDPGEKHLLRVAADGQTPSLGKVADEVCRSKLARSSVRDFPQVQEKHGKARVANARWKRTNRTEADLNEEPRHRPPPPARLVAAALIDHPELSARSTCRLELPKLHEPSRLGARPPAAAAAAAAAAACRAVDDMTPRRGQSPAACPQRVSGVTAS
eukprot:CAMPEP_0171491974 /NCGR_PEP_ID=MMETSP0958-20121227/4155_1 /TAXON_ID=87120 /ORGANISM="Aurantiochytrium limacinum, Strain ATCCMYA-1381" /LENGTH=184 /DNA_ID=CAMNT_0012025447 /DNA_START=506 /DNA_END=1062 /DNA_ORIENTATION=+